MTVNAGSAQLPIHAAVTAYKEGRYFDCLESYRRAAKTYPEWRARINFTMGAIRRQHGLTEFGKSYEATVKQVPDGPSQFPQDAALPPLQGVSNDYTFIEEAVERYWARPDAAFTLPVSVVIPVYNRSRELGFVLAGLTHQTYPRDLMEVVIADDGSQEDLAAVYKPFEKHFPIRYCRQEDLGYRLSEVRNLGIRTATHGSIVILDGDAIPGAELVERYMRVMHVSRNVALFGLRHYVSVADISVDSFVASGAVVYRQAPRVASENAIATRADANGYSIDWREEPVRATNLVKDEPLPYRFLVGANCGFPKELFERAGGYCDEFRAWGFEDQEFGYRLCREGAYFMPLMDAYVYHQEPLSGKNDVDRKMGEAVTRKIFIQKCPFVYRRRADAGPFEVPLVSIYVPLFNRERYILECVDSALQQSVDDLEVVVCDDGSTDRSMELLRKHFGRNRRVRVVRQANAGIGAASNTAVKACRGYYIGQLDADDVLKSDAVEQCLKVMEKDHRLSLVYGTTEYIDEHSNVTGEGWNWPVFTREYLLTRMIVHHFRFFRKRDWCRTSGFNESIRNAVDYDMMLKLSEVGEVRHLNRVLYQYRKHAQTTSVEFEVEQTLNNFVVLNDSLHRLGLADLTAVEAGNERTGKRVVRFVRAASR